MTANNVYSDEILYVPRQATVKNSECIIYSFDTIFIPQQWGLAHISQNDKRIKTMFENLGFTVASVVQRHCWPQLDKNLFPYLCISPASSGKTYSYLTYIIAKCIKEVPIKKMDEVLALSSQLTSFKLAAEDDKEEQADLSQEIDLDNFDFNSLGAGTKESSHEPPIIETDSVLTHPKYIIVCPGQRSVENVMRDIEEIKYCALGDRKAELPPIARSVSAHHDDEKLAFKCSGCEILVGTPAVVYRCIDLGYIKLSLCEMLIFDDLDLSLQLHNNQLRNLIKKFFIASDEAANKGADRGACQVYFYAKKFTELLHRFMRVFDQITLIFGSTLEASVYANVCYEVETTTGKKKFAKLTELVSQYSKDGNKVAIVLRTQADALNLIGELKMQDIKAEFAPSQSDQTDILRIHGTVGSICVTSDDHLDLVVESMNCMHTVIHYEMPKDWASFDQRMRLMQTLIRTQAKNLKSTIFIGGRNDGDTFGAKEMQEFYDLISRSTKTLNSTRLTLRDILIQSNTVICWRWASLGYCRLEKPCKDERRLGSFCSYKHTVDVKPIKWPTHGQVRIFITHVVNPSEFYFWFEGHRDMRSPGKAWQAIKDNGRDHMKSIQPMLDKLRSTSPCSVPLKDIVKGRVYGLFVAHESRVDRVVIVDMPKLDSVKLMTSSHTKSKIFIESEDYGKLCQVFKIDYGSRLEVYLRNLIKLPSELELIEAQCHRGFHLGYRPLNDEPDWLHKAKKHFEDSVCDADNNSVTAWLRQGGENCFWMENLTVTKRIPGLDELRLYEIKPHCELITQRLAEANPKEPPGLNPSQMLETLCMWNAEKLSSMGRRAFLSRGQAYHNIYLLSVLGNLDVIIRLSDYNPQLTDLEDRIYDAYLRRELPALGFFKEGVYCIAKIQNATANSIAPQSDNICFTMNRALIVKKENDTSYLVECLDHGDKFVCQKSELFRAEAQHIRQLPFQAIRAQLADLNEELFVSGNNMFTKAVGLLYDYSRYENEDLRKLKCTRNLKGQLYLHVPQNMIDPDAPDSAYVPLVKVLEEKHNLKLLDNQDPSLREPIVFLSPDEVEDNRTELTRRFILHLLDDMIDEELKKAGANI